MNILKRFGNPLATKLYTFPTNAQISYSDNFAQLVTKTVRLAGVNGGFSHLGMGRGLSPIGTVRVEVWLKDFTGSDATDKVNSLRQMADWGLQPLYRQPLTGAEQFCWARVTDIQTPQNVKDLPWARQRATVIFEVPDPFWYRTVGGFGFLWDDGIAKWDDGVSVWDTSTTYAVTNSLTQSITIGGNYFTLPRVQLTNSSGVNVTDIKVQRLVDSYAEDEFVYTAALATGTYLDIDPVRQRVAIQPANSNGMAAFSAKIPDWIRLMPGVNSLKITCTGSVTLSLQYMERFV